MPRSTSQITGSPTTRAVWTSTSTVTTTETVMLTCSIPANQMVVGTTYRCVFFCANSAVTAVTAAMRLGTAGTTSDTLVANTGGGTLTPGAANVGLVFEVMVTCRTTGATGTVASSLTGVSNLPAAYAQSAMQMTATASVTVNTTVANKLTFTLKAASAGVLTSYTGLIEAL